MGFSTADKQAWIKRIYRKSAENAVTLKVQIETDLDAAVDSVATGEIASISGNGMATTFAMSGMKPNDAVQLLNSIDNLYVAARSTLVAAGDATPTDAEIRDEMLSTAHLSPTDPEKRTRASADFTHLRD